MATDAPKAGTDQASPDDANGPELIHQMILGGFALVKDGQLMAVANPAVCYDNMTYAHVQTIWRFLNQNQAIQAAAKQLADVIADEMTNLGDAHGLISGRMTKQELEANYQLMSEVSLRPNRD